MEVRYITYVCQQCKETDTVKLFEDEGIPATVNCWNCRAGQGKEIREMLSTGFGMFPVILEDEKPKKKARA
jgi:Zn ribbon nucleic-acid-binding protein